MSLRVVARYAGLPSSEEGASPRISNEPAPQGTADQGEEGRNSSDDAAEESPSENATDDGEATDASEDEADDDASDAAISPDRRAGLVGRLSEEDRQRILEMEQERDARRRRQSTCTLILIFVLLRLWLEAIAQGDIGLIVLCLVGTSWTARWIRSRSEREQEVDRRVEEYIRRSAGITDDATNGLGTEEASLMSFQAQLALAIIESQRQMMMNGGMGNPDPNAQPQQGVSEAARASWDRFDYKAADATAERMEEGTSTTALASDDELGKKQPSSQKADSDLPSCSICLGEYEEGEKVVRLPCGHLYHDECVTAWVSNHVRCPLCNLELEQTPSVSVEGEEATSPTVVV